MANESLWTRYCNHFRHYPEIQLAIDVSRMRFPDSLFTDLSSKITKAFSDMKALEGGAVANPDENRMVGHYWLRAPELTPGKELREAIISTTARIKDFAKRVHQGEIKGGTGKTFSDVLIVGIGGSALGPQLVYDALGDVADKTKLHFCDNTDPDGIQRTLRKLKPVLASTLVITISKSGGTVETKNGQLEIAHFFKTEGLDFSKHAIAVTCEGSKLDQFAIEQRWLERFPMWDWVGGRTSLFSAVGLLPAALQGVDIERFVAGAGAMDQVTRANAVAQDNPAMLLALMWHYAGGGKGAKDMVVLPYKDRLVLLSKYLQQLVMESLGKEKDLSGKIVNQGIAVYGNKGSTDQHAYIQQLRDGVNNFFAVFIEVLQDHSTLSSIPTAPSTPLEVVPGVTSGDYLSGFMLGTREALYGNNRDSLTITIDSLSPFSLGALIALFERAVGYYASLVNINAYHQPGVEAGKKAAERVVALQKDLLAFFSKNSGTWSSAEEIGSAIGAESEVETIYKILEHLAANNRLKREGTERAPARARYQGAPAK